VTPSAFGEDARWIDVAIPSSSRTANHADQFEYGLDVVHDGLERVRNTA